MTGAPALELTDLDVAYRVRGRDRQVLRGVSLAVAPGESYGLVGESGCGKSTAALAAVRYLPRNGRVRAGSIRIADADVLALRAPELRRLRAGVVSMVYQDPARALNPSLRVGRQLAEVFEVDGVTGSEAGDRSRRMLERVQIADPGSVMDRYPHQLSGGMQQRVVIAMALASEPRLLILDEPTTGLDATVEAEVLDLIEELRRTVSAAVLFISHNLSVIARMCDRVGVLYAGALVEEGPAQEVFESPRHPYTVGLLRCIPRRGQTKLANRLDTIPGFLPPPGADLPTCVFVDRCGLADDRCRSEAPPVVDIGAGRSSRCHHHELAPGVPRATPAAIERIARPSGATLITVDHLSKTFRQGSQSVRAVHDAAFTIAAGETLGLVGESGSGKTTIARALLGIVAPDVGATVTLDDRPLAARLENRAQADVQALQIVFQNPDSALNRRHTVRRILRRAVGRLAGLSGEARDRRVGELAASVRLADRFLGQRPTDLSGGQKQRVAIARAFAGNPRLVVCDEPTSALDVSVQAAILNLLADLQRDEQTSYLFISHDLGVVRYLSDRIAVLYLGRVLEIGPAARVFDGPHHPYTEALLSAVPSIDGAARERVRLEGEIPRATDPPSGCVFHTRCPRKVGAICEHEEPPLVATADGGAMRCHIPFAELRRLQEPSAR